MKTYTVSYRMYQHGEEKSIQVIANNKYEAYDKATYELIPDIEAFSPYSTWVSSVTYNNGNYRKFNNFEGNAY